MHALMPSLAVAKVRTVRGRAFIDVRIANRDAFYPLTGSRHARQ
jgi:hypothetical protein